MTIKIEEVLKFQIEVAHTDPLKMREFIKKLGLQEIRFSLRCCQQNVGRDAPKRNYGLIHQDLINVLGERLGFNVEFGDYKDGPDGLWRYKDAILVVESKSSPQWLEVKQVSYYVTSHKAKSGLIVCPDFKEDHIKAASGYGNVRLITSEALCNLAELREKGIVSTEDIVNILIPQETVKLDYIVDILNKIIVKPPPPVEKEIVEEPAQKLIVAIYRSRPEGLDFLLKNNAWGYVKRPRREINYIAIHTTKPRQILYYGKVKEVIPQEKHPTLSRDDEKGKYIILLESVEKLDNPIIGPGWRGPIYTTFDKFLNAKTTKDLRS